MELEGQLLVRALNDLFGCGLDRESTNAAKVSVERKQ